MTVLTLSRTSCVARSGSFSRLKVMVTLERPCDELERISSMPGTVLTAPSMMSVISVSISCGAAPWIGRLHVDGRDVDFREAVHAEREEGEPADDRQQQDDDGREDGPPHANFS